MLIVPNKPDGTFAKRFCIDYRKLNTVTKMDAYPIPRTDEMLERNSRAKLFLRLI